MESNLPSGHSYDRIRNAGFGLLVSLPLLAGLVVVVRSFV